jgi:hypothetical protein
VLRRIPLMLGIAALATTLTAAPSFAVGTTPHTPRPRRICDPSSKTKSNAPAIGAQATYQAGNAGSVVIKRADATTLSIVSVNDTAGWTNTVSTPSGRRVRALLRNSGAGQLQHFGLGLSARGTFVMETTSFCHH